MALRTWKCSYHNEGARIGILFTIVLPTPSLSPRPNPHAGKRVWFISSYFLGLQDVILIFVATFVLVVRCHIKKITYHESDWRTRKIRPATSSSPRNHSKYSRYFLRMLRMGVGFYTNEGSHGLVCFPWKCILMKDLPHPQ